MFRTAVIALAVCAESFDGGEQQMDDDVAPPEVQAVLLTEKQTTLPVLGDDTLGDLFSKHSRRLVVSVPESDFATVSNANGKEYKDLQECSNYFFDLVEKAEDRFALMFLNTTESTMLEDAKMYLNCTELPCYSLELEDESAMAYTRPIKDFGIEYVSSAAGIKHDFLASCKKFVDLYLNELKQGTVKYHIADPEAGEVESEDLENIDPEM